MTPQTNGYLKCRRTATIPPRNAWGFTLVEILMALGVFSIGSLVIWSCVDSVLFLSAKNYAINLSHSSLQSTCDRVASTLGESVQIVDVSTFNGTAFANVADGQPGNAVRFVRVLPTTLFMLPDDGSNYTMNQPQDPTSSSYPNLLTGGNRTVKVSFNPALATTPDPRDLTNARLFPRFPYLKENVVAGSSPGLDKPGLALAAVPNLTNSPTNITLTNGLPATSPKVPSCNSAFLVIESAFAVLNRGNGSYAELLYFPDAADTSRTISFATSLQADTAQAGPLIFRLLSTAGAAANSSARASLQMNLQVRARDYDNAVQRRGGVAALSNATVTLPLETRRRSRF